jgi:hypothetical protein
VVVASGLTPDLQARADRLRTALMDGLPAVMAANQKLQLLQASGATIVDSGQRVPAAIGELGADAAACALMATTALPPATVQVSVSIEVSASVSASASGGGSS